MGERKLKFQDRWMFNRVLCEEEVCRKVLRAAVSMALMALVYTLTIWAVILLAPHFLISIFSSDPTLQADTIPAMKLYFSTFGFMLLQYVGQTVFKSLNKRRHAVFFSLLRKVIIVVPLTYLLPYAFGMGTDGVFAAEPVSNVIGGSLCFIVMLITVLPELKRMDREDARRAAYYNYYSSGTWGMASTYHLCVDSSVLGIDGTVDFVLEFVERKLGVKPGAI